MWTKLFRDSLYNSRRLISWEALSCTSLCRVCAFNRSASSNETCCLFPVDENRWLPRPMWEFSFLVLEMSASRVSFTVAFILSILSKSSLTVLTAHRPQHQRIRAFEPVYRVNTGQFVLCVYVCMWGRGAPYNESDPKSTWGAERECKHSARTNIYFLRISTRSNVQLFLSKVSWLLLGSSYPLSIPYLRPWFTLCYDYCFLVTNLFWFSCPISRFQ